MKFVLLLVFPLVVIELLPFHPHLCMFNKFLLFYFKMEGQNFCWTMKNLSALQLAKFTAMSEVLLELLNSLQVTILGVLLPACKMT